MKKLITGCIICLLPLTFFAQADHKKKTKESGLTIAFSGGVNFSNMTDQMEKAMEDMDLGDDAFIPPTLYRYPRSEKNIGSYDVWVEYQFNTKSAVLIGGSLMERCTTRGRNDTDVGIILESKIHQVRCQYVIQGDSRWSMSIGPSLIFIDTEDIYPMPYDLKYSTTSLGITGGLSFHFIEAKSFFFFLSAIAHYVFPTEIGPFYAHRVQLPPDWKHPLKFNPEISISSVSFQLGFGWKF